VLAIAEAVCRHREPRASTARCSSAATRTRSPSPRSARSSRVLGAHGVDVVLDADGGATPTPVISHRSSPTTAAAGRGRPTASSSPRRTTRPATAASSTTRRTGARPTPTSRAGSRTRPTRCSRRGLDGVRRVAYERAEVRPARLRQRLRRRSRRRHRPRGDPRRGPQARRRPARRREPALLGGDRRTPWARPRGRQRGARPDLPLVPLDWDGKIRMDCSSPYAMARLRDSRTASTSPSPTTRRGPPRHRHARRRAAEPQPPPRRCVAYLFGGAREWGEDVGSARRS
jgi:phosphoglucomutase